MKGFYFYCIRLKTDRPLGLIKTISGKKEEVEIIPYRDVEAVTSKVDLGEFGSEEIQRKAQQDLMWIKEKAQIHEQVIERAMRSDSKLISVIPMKFGIIFKTEKSLKNCLENQYQEFKDILEKLKGKQEWGVKVYLKEKVFREIIENKNKAVLAKKKEIESIPQGIAFFAQKQIGKIVNEEKDKKLNGIVEKIYENLGQIAVSKNKTKLLEKDFTGKVEKMILNASYLLEETKIDQFKKNVENLKEKYNPQGLEIKISGPWPSYNFA